jgi:hypothetical protein
MTLAPSIDRPRIATLREQRPAWSYFLSRRRRHAQPPFNTPPDIAGLKLWLDASIGVMSTWQEAPASGTPWIDYSASSGYTAGGYDHAIRIYPFRTVSGNRVYSANYLELQTTDDGTNSAYHLNWSWDAVAGAEGYRILKSDTGNGYAFDYFYDANSESFVDTGPGMFSAGSDVLPQDLAPASPGQAITQWNDQSGLNHHALQANPTLRALLEANVVNGRPVLRFDADDGYTTSLVLNTPCTVFAVYAVRTAEALARRAVNGSNNWLLGPYGPVHEFYNASGFTGGPASAPGQFVVQAAWQDGGVSRNFLNGAFVGAALGAGGGPGTFGLGTGGSAFEPLDGDLAEVIAYDSALCEANLTDVWNYLAAKFALS